jgi:hypothetical protein
LLNCSRIFLRSISVVSLDSFCNPPPGIENTNESKSTRISFFFNFNNFFFLHANYLWKWWTGWWPIDRKRLESRRRRLHEKRKTDSRAPCGGSSCCLVRAFCPAHTATTYSYILVHGPDAHLVVSPFSLSLLQYVL